MAITPAHPAFVLPFRRWGLPASALVIGSVVPDLGHFSMIPHFNDFTHGARGIVLFCLPAGLLLDLSWQAWFKAPAAGLLRLEPGPDAPRPSVPVRLSALVLAIALHLLLDLSTHTGTRLPAYWQCPVLAGHVWSRPYLVLYGLASLGGLAWMGVLVRRALRRGGHPPLLALLANGLFRGPGGIMIVLAAFGAWAWKRGAYHQRLPENLYQLRDFSAFALCAFACVFGALSVLYTAWWHLRRRKPPGAGT